MTVPSIRKLAEALGISHTILNRHKRAGKFSEEPTGGYDVEKVRRQLHDNVDPVQSRSIHVVREAPKQSVEQVDLDLQPEPSPTPGTLNYEQWRLTQAKADQAELERKRLTGELMPVKEAEAVRIEMAVKFRDAVMGLRSQVINRLPAEWRREISAVMDEEGRKLLNALSDEFRADPKAA